MRDREIVGRAANVPIDTTVTRWDGRRKNWQNAHVTATVELRPVESSATAYAAKGPRRDKRLPSYDCFVDGVRIGNVNAYQGTSERHYNRIRVVTGHPILWGADPPQPRWRSDGYRRGDYGHRTRKDAICVLIRYAVEDGKIKPRGGK